MAPRRPSYPWRHRLFAVLPLVLTTAPAQRDLLVHSSEPGAYRTLHAAMNAAMPGDRILLGEDVLLTSPLPIRKSVTIQSRGGRHRIQMPGETSMRLSPYLRIEALSPGIPFELREIELSLFEMSAAVRGMGTVGHVSGEVRFHDVQVQYLMDRRGGWGGVWALDVDVDRLWLRDTDVTVEDQFSNFGCVGLMGGFGGSCLRVRASLLVLENCNLRAGSALYLLPHPNGCFQGSGILSSGGNGGTALAADTAATFLTRSVFSDGNGGGLQSGNWYGSTLIPGAPGASTFVGQGGLLLAYATTRETGLAGAVSPMATPDPKRGTTVRIGEREAPLTVGGDPRLGGILRAEVPAFPQAASVIAVTLDWRASATPVGAAAIPTDGPLLLLPISPAYAQEWPIPPAPELFGVSLASQLFYLRWNQWRVGNFSGTWIAR